MTENAQLIPVENDIQPGLPPQVLTHLNSYDDYVDYYIQLEQASSGFSWMKADLLLQVEKKLGEKSLRVFSGEVNQPQSTITNYIRVARAFDKERRDVGASFSTHFQASFADSYDEETKSFKSDTRFDWLNKAIDEKMSTRKLAQEIQKHKERSMITAGDGAAIQRQFVKETLHEIQLALGAIAQKASQGSGEHLEQLGKIKEFIYGKKED